MFSIRKKGIADIVAVTLIILLSTVSVSLMFSYVSKATSNISPQFDCVYAQANQIYKLENACIDNSSPPNPPVKAGVSRNIQDDTTTNILKITLSKTIGNTLSYECGPETSCFSAEIPKPGTNREFILTHSFENLSTFNIAHLSVNDCIIDNIPITICS